MHRSLSYQATHSLPLSTSPLATVDHMCLQQQWTRQWIELTLQQTLPITNLFLCLRTGVILCRLMNKLQPGAVPQIHYNECVSAKKKNIQQFLNAGLKIGLHDSELFNIDDLLEGRNMNAVIWTLFRLSLLVNRKHSMSWSSYELHSMDSRVLSTPSPCISDNNKISNHYHHADQRKPSIKRNSINMEKGLTEDKETNANDTSSLPFGQQKRRQGSQGIKYYHLNSHPQPHYSLSSLPDEDQLFDDNDCHLEYPSTSNLPYKMSRSIKTVSSDSGYGTTRQSSWDRRKTENTRNQPIQLMTLFDRAQHSSPASTSTYEDNSPCTKLIMGDNSSISTPSKESTKIGKDSIPSRLVSLSFGKKFSLRQNTPFHMRFQEWTDTCLSNNANADDNSNRSNHAKPSVIDMFLTADNNASSPIVQSSVSSPLLSKNNSVRSRQRHQSIIAVDLSTKKPTSPISSAPLSSTPVNLASKSTHRTSYNEYMTRRKSTGNLTTQNDSNITQAPSDSIDENVNLELIDSEGQISGNYKLGNVIGKGQFGIVYRALELRTGKMVAVKRIKLHSSKKRDMVDVMQEAQLLQRLSHPNVVKYEGFIQTEGHVNIILEYVENGSLSNTLKSFGSFPENLVASYCTRILHGLQYLHHENVVHCDLKAANLLTTKSGHVKLSDFGVSLNLGLKETEVGNVAGTPNWMAPEVIELKGASTKSDIWSLGCTIIELCTGKPPYSDLLPMTALFRIVEDDYPPIPDGLSQDLCDFLKNCFAKNPDDRPTATDLLTHAWICKYHEGSNNLNDTSSFTDVDVCDQSTPVSLNIWAGLETAPNTPLDMEDIENDCPPWLVPVSGTKYDSHSSSVLATKFQQHQQQTHRYVKGTFPKGAVKCKSCQLPIKKNAFICEDCGFICHDQCKTEIGCNRSTFTSAATPPPLPPPLLTKHGQPSPTPTLSYNQEPMSTSIMDQQQKKRRPTSSYSIQALLSTSSSSLSLLSSPSPPRHQQRRQSSIMIAPKPRASVSTQLRQQTRKLSRVFSSKPNPPNQPHTLHHGYKSNDSLRLIKEEQSTRPKHAHGSFSPSPSLPTEPISSNDTKVSNRRDKLKRRTTHPDDCIIS